MQNFFESESMSEVQEEFQHVEIPLLMSFWQELRAEISLHQWNEEQGFRYVLAAGLAALRNQPQSEALAQDESVLPTVIQKIHNEQVHLYGRYAEARHYANELKATATNLEVQLKACKIQLELLRKVNTELLTALVRNR